METIDAMLQDVRLYGQDGQPLDIGRGATDPNRRVVAAADGVTVFNSFPIRYYDPNTQRVAQPGLAPAGLAPPPLATPALTSAHRP